MWLIAAAVAAPGPGERLQWDIEWMGVTAGSAEATTAAATDHWQLELRTRSAGWVDALYPVDDHMLSRWDPARGTLGYQTRFREGRFQQDQDIRFGADGIVADRRQLFGEGWRSWTDRYDPVSGLEDPLSALWRLRHAVLEGEVRFPVWTGRALKTLRARVLAREALAERPAVKLDIAASSHELEDVQGRITVWLSDDAERLPLKAAVKTRAGVVTAFLRAP